MPNPTPIDPVNTRITITRLNDHGENERIALFCLNIEQDDSQILISTRYAAMRFVVLDASASRYRLLGAVQDTDKKLLRYEIKESRLIEVGVWDTVTQTYSVSEVFTEAAKLKALCNHHTERQAA